MSDSPEPENLTLIHSLMARWDAQRAAGLEPDLDDLCPDPVVREQLRRRVAASADFVAGRAAPLPADGTTPELPRTLATDCPPPPLPGSVIEPPGYKIERELGRGQFGVVYQAIAEKLRRTVALKLLTLATPETVGRLVIEARAMAAIRHPHVAQIYDIGEHAGVHFLVLEYLPGGTLSERLCSGAVPYRKAAELLAAVARGVAAAHDLGIVHRDLKPSNILFDQRDESGRPKVSDFGMAKYGNADLTVPEAVIGTPAYMSPEQAGARGKFAQPAADVWALGVMLYECVTGARPFTGRTIMEVLLQITNDDPKRMRELVPDAPADLQTIVDKCLRRDERDRYATAEELADDLDAFLQNAPIKARPLKWHARLARWVARKPEAAAAWVLAPLVAVAVAVALTFNGLWRDAVLARQDLDEMKAQQLKQQEEAAQKRFDEMVQRVKETQTGFEYGRAVDTAHREWRLGDTAGARLRLARLDPARPDWDWNYVRRLCQPDLVAGGGDNSGTVHAAAFDTSGARVATGHGDGTVRVWDAATRTPRPPFRVANSGGVLAVAFSPDGTRLAAGTASHKVLVWDIASGRELLAVNRFNPVKAVAFSPDGKRLVAGGGRDNAAQFWSTETGAELPARIPHADAVVSIAFSPDGERVLTASWDKTARLSEVETGKLLFTLGNLQNDYLLSAAFSADGTRAVTACFDGEVRVWRTVPGVEPRVIASFNRPPGTVWAAALSPDGERVVTAEGGKDEGNKEEPKNAARVWDITGAVAVEVFAVKAHTGAVLVAKYSPNGARVLTASDDGTAGLWSAYTGGESLTLRKPAAPTGGRPARPTALGYSPDGTQLVAAFEGAPAQAWEAVSGKPVNKYDGPVPSKPEPRVGRGDRGATLGAEGTVTVSDAKTGVTFKLGGHIGPVNAVALNPRGTRIVTAGQDGVARVWDAAYGVELLSIKASGGPVSAATWSPDGTRLVTATEDGTVQIWDSKP